MDTLSLQQAISDLNLELFLTILLVVILFGVGILVGRFSLRREVHGTHYWNQSKASRAWWNNFWQGISTELFGAVFTTIGFGIILLIFQQYQTIQNDKADLILQMGSPDNSIAIEAVRIAHQKGWINEGILVDAFLMGANLENARLHGVDLSKVDLMEANLYNADIRESNLQNASLIRANLRSAILAGSNLTGVSLAKADLQSIILSRANLNNAYLWDVNLEGASLQYANLQGANLQAVNLQHVNVYGVVCDETTILPDGESWTENTDWTQFGAVEIEHSLQWASYLYEHSLLQNYYPGDIERYEDFIQGLREFEYID